MLFFLPPRIRLISRGLYIKRSLIRLSAHVQFELSVYMFSSFPLDLARLKGADFEKWDISLFICLLSVI